MAYGVDSTPPRLVTTIAALQLIGVNVPSLLLPVLVASAAGLPADAMTSVVGTTMLVTGVGTAFQLCRRRFGCGFPIGAGPANVLLLPGLLAAREGGLPLLTTMTVLSGLLEVALSRVVTVLRPFFAPEISGLILILSAMTLGADSLFELTAGEAAATPQGLLGLATFGLLMCLSVWGGRVKTYALLIGLGTGYIATVAFGLGPRAVAIVADSSWIGLPHLGAGGFAFSWNAVPIYLVATVAVVLKEMADISTFQKLTDADWVRPEFASLRGGILANGTANILAGFFGTMGVSPNSSAIGVVAATGVASRLVGAVVAVLYLALAFMPKIAAVLVATPRPVLAAAMMYVASFILVNGLQIITSRLLDARRVLMIGMAMFVGVLSISHRLPVDLLPRRVRALADAPLVVSTLVAMALNIVFRLGIRRTRHMRVALDPLDLVAVEDFLDHCGAEWAARPAMISRVRFAAAQTLETLAELARGSALLSASFDEFTLVVEIAYDGEAMPLPDLRPDERAILDDPAGTHLLAGWMLRRNADRVQCRSDGPRQTLTFMFDH
jgi:xanthine permease XanP